MNEEQIVSIVGNMAAVIMGQQNSPGVVSTHDCYRAATLAFKLYEAVREVIIQELSPKGEPIDLRTNT